MIPYNLSINARYQSQFNTTNPLYNKLIYAPIATSSTTGINYSSGKILSRLGTSSNVLQRDFQGLSFFNGATSGNGWDSPSPLNPSSNNEFTIATWVRPIAFSIMELFNIETSDSIILRLDTNSSRIRAYIRNSASTAQGADINNVWQVNSTHHFAMTYKNNTILVYKNGVLIGSASTSGTLLSTTNDWRLGLHANGTSNPLAGYIWRMYGWSRQLTADEILYLYRDGDFDLWNIHPIYINIPGSPSPVINPKLLTLLGVGA